MSTNLRNFFICTLVLAALFFFGEYQNQGQYLFNDPIGVLLGVYLTLGAAVTAGIFAVVFIYRRVQTPSSR